MLLQAEKTRIRHSVCLWKYDISDPTLVDLTSNFFGLCTNVKGVCALRD